jgi:hypothetical protein
VTDDRTTDRTADRAADPAADRAADPAADRATDRAGREPGELVIALSPGQIIGGFAFVAGLILWFIRRARRKG